MTTEEISVLVFKTNLTQPADILAVASVLSKEKHVLKWNIDFQDIDKVLRIETTCLSPAEVALLVQHAGFLCEELPD